MPWNNDGTYTPTVGTYTGASAFQRLEDDGANVEAAPFTAFLTDLKTVIEGFIRQDGSTVPSENLPMNGRKHLNVDNAVNDTEYAAWGQVRPAIIPAVTDITANTNITLSHRYNILRVNASGAARLLTLPNLTASDAGYYVTVTKTDSSNNTVSIMRSGTATIKGNADIALREQYQYVTLLWDGSGKWESIIESLGTIDGLTKVTVSASDPVSANLQDGELYLKY